MNDDELDAALRRAPRTADTPLHIWPELERKLSPRRETRGRLTMAAAAVVIFCLGGLAGLVAGRAADGADDERRSGPPIASPAFIAAARVQSAGSAYLAALGEMDALARRRSADEASAFHQGYEAALAVVDVVAETVRRAPLAHPGAERLATEAQRVRAAAGSRGTELFREEGTR